MRTFTAFLVLATFLNLFSIATAGSAMNDAQKLNAFFAEEWEYQLKQSPLTATNIGDSRYNNLLDDFSIEAVKQDQKHDDDALARLHAISQANLKDQDKLNYDLFERNLKLAIEGHQFHGYLMPITQLHGVQQTLPQLPMFTPFVHLKDYEDYLQRMSKIPVAMDQVIATMKQGLAEKITPPRITLRDVGEQIKAQVVSKPEDSSFYQPFKDFADGISQADQERLKKNAASIISTQVIPSYQKLYDFWTKEYYPNTRESIGASDLPNGAAWYAYRIKWETTTDLTARQIHEIGLQEVKRIRTEMDQVIKETGFKGNFDEFVHFLRTDPQFFYTKPEDLLTGYRDICKRIDAQLPLFFGKLPRLTYGVREVPAFSAPSQTTAYYDIGSVKAGRAGWFCANTYKLDTRPKWEMEALSMHESVPGHHLQLALAQELENVPEFRRYSGYTAFVEGWGLYSESLGPDMGMYKDPYSKFGQLTYEIWRAIRLVVDTGMHSMGWTREQAIDYFKSNSAKMENDIVVEIDRYIVWPGQALAYKLGELKIKELKKYSQDQLGDRFDIHEFHDHVLENGAVPLTILEAQIKAYVAAKKAQPATKT
jgi:uncharacterized protein (DUF885 family)